MTAAFDDLAQEAIRSKQATHRILDESLFTGVSKTSKLLCSIETGCISVAVADTASSKIIGFESFHFPPAATAPTLADQVRTLPESSSILKKVDFKSVSVQFCNLKFTLIPAALFRAAEAEQYYSFNHPSGDYSRVFSEQNSTSGIVNVFGVPADVFAAAVKLFENFSVHHHLTSLIQATRMETLRDQENNFFLNVHSGILDVIVYKDGRLLLCNSFAYKSDEDALYFALFVCEQLGLRPEKIRATLTGQVSKESTLARLLQQYIPNMAFGQRAASIRFTYGFDELEPHLYYSDFSHLLCESSAEH